MTFSKEHMHKLASKKTISMEGSSKKCKKRGKRTSGKRGKKRIHRKLDYISDLPDHVLHQVLYHLHPRDAARTSILSKRWRQIWNSYQVVDLDLCSYPRMKKGVKVNYKNQMLARLLNVRGEQFHNLHKFRLCFTLDLGIIVSDAADWIMSAIKRNVKELEVHAKNVHSPPFSLPSCVMTGSFITSLSLHNCRIPTYEVDLPNLQKLSLKNMNVSLLLFKDLISGCPLIEDLRLIKIYCLESKELSICTLDRLRRVDVHKCHALDSIAIEARCLKTFWYYCDKKRLCKINLSACMALKELILDYPRMTDKMFHEQIMEFPKLEKLVLSRCNGLKSIHISGDKLRKLVIRRCWKLEESTIASPNLTSLEYRGQRMPFSFLTCISLKEVLLSFEPSSKVSSKWEVGGSDASKLYRFLDDIDRYKGLKLMTLNKQEIIIYEDIRAMVLPLRHISKPHAIRISTRFQDLVDAALKTSPIPSTLSIMSHISSDFPEVL